MALPNSSSSPSSSSKPSLSPTSPLPSKSPHFTPIHEGEKVQKEFNHENSPTTPNNVSYKQHQRTPLHNGKTGKSQPKRDVSNDDVSIACNNCRPHPCERISVVPLDGNSRHSFPSPNGVIKSLLSTLSRKSPRSTSDMSPSTAAREEHYKIALAELSHRLVQVTRKRDEAILEASRLKHSMTDLEKKLNRLELYCHNLKSGLDEQFRSLDSPHRTVRNNPLSIDGRLIGDFLNSVSEARSTVRNLSRSLIVQTRSTGSTKVYEKITMLLQPYDVKMSTSAKNQRELVFYLEALLNKTFFEDFETASFWRYSESITILNPTERCEANRAAYCAIHALTWEEVLSKGTRHFSEEFSKFCDRRMSEIVAMLGWTRPWTEGLLQAFFDASKSVWLVHLLANSVYPALAIFRVDKAFRFDPVYMEDIEADRVRSRLVPTVVRVMVAPGFYVYDNVIKCKVLCRYYSISHSSGISDEKVLITSP